MNPKINRFTAAAPKSAHEVSYTEWGSHNENVLVCVHGLTRNGRDFDELAKALSASYRVICPDMPGRGKSGWLDDHDLYNNNYYVQVIIQFLGSIGVKKVDWVGTSMGGIMGMIAAAVYPGLIGRMVLNDVGAMIPVSGMRRIASYVKDEVKFGDASAAQKRFREIFAPFKIEKEEHWQHLFEHGLREVEGGYSFNHDPAIGKPFQMPDNDYQEVDMWRLWEAVNVPTLLVRGEKSDILPREVAGKMAEKPGVEFVEFAGYGHVPPLMNEEQIGVVKDFLLKP